MPAAVVGKATKPQKGANARCPFTHNAQNEDPPPTRRGWGLRAQKLGESGPHPPTHPPPDPLRWVVRTHHQAEHCVGSFRFTAVAQFLCKGTEVEVRHSNAPRCTPSSSGSSTRTFFQDATLTHSWSKTSVLGQTRHIYAGVNERQRATLTTEGPL